MNPRLVLLAWQYRRELAWVALALAVGLLAFLAMIAGALASVPLVRNAQIDLYQKAAAQLTAPDGTNLEGLSWQLLIAIDAVRYQQDFSRADPASIQALAEMFIKEIEEPGNEPCSGTQEHCQCKTEADEKTGEEIEVCTLKPYVRYTLASTEEVLARLPLTDEQRRLIWTMGAIDAKAFMVCLNFKPKADLFAWPAAGTLTSCFGPRRDPVTGLPADHTGVDIAAAEGAPVYAAAAGTVTFAGTDGEYGQVIHLNHDGTGAMMTLYGHLNSFEVARGAHVDKGVLIGRVGNTGKSTGSHLHFEWRVNGTPVDPLTLYR